jgi:ATP-binding cassette subfamily C exporter for protease/lipase
MRTLLRYRREFYLAAVFSAGVNLLMLTPTLYMLQVYDRVMVSQNEYTLIAVSVITVALFGLMALCEWARSRLLVSTGLRLDDDLSSRVFNATFDHRLASANAPGARPQRSFSDLLLLRQFITGNGAFAFFDLPWVPIYLVVMFVLHPVLGWASLIFALVQMAMAGFGHQRTLRPTEAAQQPTNSSSFRASCATPKWWRAWECLETFSADGHNAMAPRSTTMGKRMGSPTASWR